jgi:hypothetical protein
MYRCGLCVHSHTHTHIYIRHGWNFPQSHIKPIPHFPELLSPNNFSLQFFLTNRDYTWQQNKQRGRNQMPFKNYNRFTSLLQSNFRWCFESRKARKQWISSDGNYTAEDKIIDTKISIYKVLMKLVSLFNSHISHCNRIPCREMGLTLLFTLNLTLWSVPL